MAHRQAQLWPLGWQMYYPDAENIFQLFYSKNASPGPNESNYGNPAYDALYEKALNVMSDNARVALYRRMAAMIVEDCPWIFGVHNTEFYVSQARLRNFKPHHFATNFAKYLSVTR
jgi:ABC-type transport system substrate-binding protein